MLIAPEPWQSNDMGNKASDAELRLGKIIVRPTRPISTQTRIEAYAVLISTVRISQLGVFRLNSFVCAEESSS